MNYEWWLDRAWWILLVLSPACYAILRFIDWKLKRDA